MSEIPYFGVIDTPMPDTPPPEMLEAGDWLETGPPIPIYAAERAPDISEDGDTLEPDPRREEQRLLQDRF